MTTVLLRRGLWLSIVGSMLGVAGFQLGGAAFAAPSQADEAAAPTQGPATFGNASVKPPPLSNADTRVVALLHNLNQDEIRAGKLAKENGHIKLTREFGASLVRDHERADKEILAYAKKQGIEPKDVLPAAQEAAARHRARLDRLGMLSGADFDRAFASAMLEGHESALDMVQKARSGVSDHHLATILGNLQPMLNKHIDMAKKLVAKYRPNPTYTKEPPVAGTS